MVSMPEANTPGLVMPSSALRPASYLPASNSVWASSSAAWAPPAVPSYRWATLPSSSLALGLRWPYSPTASKKAFSACDALRAVLACQRKTPPATAATTMAVIVICLRYSWTVSSSVSGSDTIGGRAASPVFVIVLNQGLGSVAHPDDAQSLKCTSLCINEAPPALPRPPAGTAPTSAARLQRHSGTRWSYRCLLYTSDAADE